jgi:uncharacterized protein
MKGVVIYKPSSSSIEEIMKVYPRHKAYLEEFKKERKIYGIGPFSDRQGSLGIFKSVEDAKMFVKNDPFVLEGLTGEIEIKEWKDD